jgi:hypothetical protein
MLFTPKKYDEDWNRIFGISFCVASLGFAFCAILSAWTDQLGPTDKIFGVVGFVLAAIVFGALGKDRWNQASRMGAERRKRDHLPR